MIFRLDEAAWVRLHRLLTMPLWSKRDAVFIVAGFDPSTDWPACEAIPPELIMLPGGILPEWRELSPTQVEDRLAARLSLTEMVLRDFPAKMPPYAWLSEAGRESQDGRPAVIPPWQQAARLRAGLKDLLPPDRIGRPGGTARRRRWDREKTLVLQQWEAWRFGEAVYANKGDFIRKALAIIAVDGLDEKALEKWIHAWEREACVGYGKYVSSDGKAYVGYGHPSVMVGSVAAGRPKR